MRNIYDIISEQKALVDVNISSYELVYISEEFDYVQEGIGEGIKNLVKKIVEFIKTVIKKIKEFISKVVGYFKRDRDFVKEADVRIKEVTNNLANHPAAKGNMAKQAGIDGDAFEKSLDEISNKLKEKDKQNEKSSKEIDKKIKDNNANDSDKGARINVSFNGKAESLLGLLKITNGKVTTPDYGPIQNKMDIIANFDKMEPAFNEFYNSLDNPEEFLNKESGFMGNIVKKAIFGKEDADVRKELIQKFGDKNDTITFDVKAKAQHIYDYMVNGRIFSKKLWETGREIESEFNETIKELESAARMDPNKVENIDAYINKMNSEIRNVSNIMTTLCNTTCRSTTTAYNHYKAICNKVIDAYAASMGKTGKVDRKEVRKGMYATAPEKDYIGEME